MSLTDKQFEDRKRELEQHLGNHTRAVKDYEGFTFGERVRVLEDSEEDGVYAGDEGTVIIEKVGHAGGYNERTGVFLLIDGQIDPVEITALEVEST